MALSDVDGAVDPIHGVSMPDPKKTDDKPSPNPTIDSPTSDPIIQQGTPPANVPQVAPRTAPAGLYRVVHGSITFAPGKTAYPGALVNLSAEDAGLMLDVGTVEPSEKR